MIQYSQDYDERVPDSWYGTSNGASAPGGNYKWMDVVYPYIKSTQVFTCPSASDQKFTLAKDLPSASDLFYGSYLINAVNWQESMELRGPGSGGFLMNVIEAPATTLWVADSSGQYHLTWDNKNVAPSITTNAAGYKQLVGQSTSFPTPAAVVERHLDTTGVLFCDGHVKAQKLTSLVVKNAAGYMPYFTCKDD